MELEVKGQKYKTGRLSALKQLHLVRRLAPIMLALSAAAADTPDAPVSESDKPIAKAVMLDQIAQAFTPLITAISKMEDKEVDYVVSTCLAVVEREDNGRWAKVQNTNGTLQYQDIDLPTMIQLAQAVIQENLAAFFPGPQAA